ncbi:MAG TPA: hypothetical protein VGD49_03525, partial [Longimicrobiales bacterium]
MLQLKHRWMMVPLLVGGIAFSGMLSLAEAQQASTGNVRLRVARFWRGEGRTLLEGVVGLPLAREPRSLEFSVRDNTGKVLHTEAWTDSARTAMSGLSSATVATKFELVLMPGTYTVVARSTEGSRTDSASVTVQAFDAAPMMSDAVVSARMRALQQGEAPDASEMQRGRYAIQRGAQVTVLPAEPRLWYYLELYPQQSDSIADLWFRVLPEGKDSPLVRVNRKVRVSERGTVDAASMVVQGLPPGNYRLVISGKSGGRDEQRETQFSMASIDVVASAPVALGSGPSESTLYDRYFTSANRPDAEINSIIESLIVAAPGE